MDDLAEVRLDKLYPRDCRDIKKAITVEQFSTGMYVVAYVIDKHDEGNQPLQISIQEGESLCGDVYDTVKDRYHVYGVDWFDIGHLPVNYNITIEGIDNWSVDVPLPLPVLRRYMSPTQRRRFDLWKNQFPDEQYLLSFIQAVSVY